MFLEKIQVQNYRNFVESDAFFSQRLNVFIGDNGQGKTNLLEALFLSLQGDTFRYADNINLIRSGQEFSLIKTMAIQRQLKFEIKTQIMKSRKHQFLNGKRVTASDLKKEFSVVIFSPESLSSIKEGADFRRILIDDMLINFDKNNAYLIADYRKALKTRNRILKNFVDNKESKTNTNLLIDSITPEFLNLGAKLCFVRITALKGLLDDIRSALRRISNNSEDLEVQYLISGENALQYFLRDIHSLLQSRARELREAELSSGVSLVGPHKHDIVFLYGQKDSRFYCSQGQQRAIILAFKMAQIVYHRRAHNDYPILMLDDVLSELDQKKRDSLISFLHEINAQTFVTTTDLAFPEKFSRELVAVFEIKNGQILQ